MHKFTVELIHELEGGRQYMLYHLIKLGEALESEVKQSEGRLYFDSVNFGVWVSKSILYIEKYHKK
ncbi:hypothetical protein XO27_0052 [Bacillus phage BtiUFT6.51-F]|uniref:Uncharacterized protein n=1 Tax=Bacillus phage BtiUFT6.51-F TaxID=2069313 RepID=A0A2I6UF54_9CAUD|nr:hypothetical protein XO27_0052 [Bacillus phage BtiUFT6.51-F]